MSEQSGIVVVDKPAGLTSHQVVARLRRLAGTRKVGHAGTLDPMATGVLLIGIGRATRLLGHLALTDKEYEATIRLGIATVTDDADGEATEVLGAAGVTDPAIADRIAALTGEIQQVPSSVSAIKINGVRSYARVRAGDRVELAARPVTVHSFDLLGRTDRRVDVSESTDPATAAADVGVVDLDVRVVCSSGTYIRALARDLGQSLGVGGHLTRLRRTRIGSFQIASAHTLDELADDLAVLDLATVTRRLFPAVELTAEQAAWVRNGRKLSGLELGPGLTAVYDPSGEFLALYRPRGDQAVPEAVFV